MRLVATADWHLGHRRFDRMTKDGINVREADVGRTFVTLINRMIALAPDVILVGGDIFDKVNPGNLAIVHAYAELSRLRAALPETIIVMVLGNHDAPKSSSAGCIVPLFSNLGIHVADRPMRYTFAERGLSILAIPDAPGVVRPTLVPDPNARINLCVMHGEVQGMPRHGGVPANEISVEEIAPAAWDFLAIGHYHVRHILAPNMEYPGAIDYVSSDVCGEQREEIVAGIPGKGFVERDLETGISTFHVLAPSRALIDLPAIHAGEMTPEQLDAAIRDAAESVEIDDAMVRLLAHDVTREIARSLDQKALREYRRRALNFNLDLRRPETIVRVVGERVRVRRQSLDEMLREIVIGVGRGEQRSFAPDVDRNDVAALSERYLAEATAKLAERGTDDTRILTPANTLQRSA